MTARQGTRANGSPYTVARRAVFKLACEGDRIALGPLIKSETPKLE